MTTEKKTSIRAFKTDIQLVSPMSTWPKYNINTSILYINKMNQFGLISRLKYTFTGVVASTWMFHYWSLHFAAIKYLIY